MEELEKERHPVRPTKKIFDESKLTPQQRKAYEIAKAQGAKFSRTLKGLALNIEPKSLNNFVKIIEEERLQARRAPMASPFED